MVKYIFILLCMVSVPVAFSQEEVTVTEVMVWVKATDRSGKAITGLLQSDFEVFEDGKPMAPTCFEETEYSQDTTVTSTQTAPAEQAPETAVLKKRVALILDQFNTQQAEYLNIRPKVVDFLKQVPPNWEFMFASLIPGAIEVNVPFTTDMKAIETKLEQVTANSMRDIEVLNRRRSILNLLDRGGQPQIIDEAYRMAQAYADDEKHMSRESIRALQRFEKDLVGWKSDSHMVVLYISGGINSEPGKQYFDIIDRKLGGTNRSALGMREGSTDLWSLLRKVVAQLNRHNITFYTINTRGTVSPAPDQTVERRREIRLEDSTYLDDTQELMSEIADETGGLYFENSLNFRKGFDLILGDLDHQYLICYKAPAHKKKEELHKIKVTTKKSGVKLRHRKAYMD